MPLRHLPAHDLGCSARSSASCSQPGGLTAATSITLQVARALASPGFVRRIASQHLPRLLGDFDPGAIQRRLSGIIAPLGAVGVTWATTEAHLAEAGLRNQVELLTSLLADKGTGLLITLDEVHRNQIGELRDLATTVQHAFREERELAFAGAGLASAISDVTTDEVLTFLRRAERHTLGAVGRRDVERALKEPIEASGRQVREAALTAMAAGTRGYPFLIQLVGAQSWRLHPSSPEITIEDARQGVANALRRLGSLVHEPALADTSAIDRSLPLGNGPGQRPLQDGRHPAQARGGRQLRQSVPVPAMTAANTRFAASLWVGTSAQA